MQTRIRVSYRHYSDMSQITSGVHLSSETRQSTTTALRQRHGSVKQGVPWGVAHRSATGSASSMATECVHRPMTLPHSATIATPRKPLPVSRQRYKLTKMWKYAELRPRGCFSLSQTGSRPARATDATCRVTRIYATYSHISDMSQITYGVHVSSKTR